MRHIYRYSLGKKDNSFTRRHNARKGWSLINCCCSDKNCLSLISIIYVLWYGIRPLNVWYLYSNVVFFWPNLKGIKKNV